MRTPHKSHPFIAWPLALLAAILVFAALLRLEALTATYGAVESPAWLRVVQKASARTGVWLRPSVITYHPAPLYPHKDAAPTRYFSDAHTYLEYARAMTSFYGAHYREPVFPAATRVWLAALGDQDVAVSLASMSFSVLAVLAAYLLGSAAFSRWVGLGAALAMAIEEHLITEGITGGRDEAFMFAVALFAWALVRCRRSPSVGREILAGAIGGFACLVRITSVSFVVPGLACLLVVPGRPWKTRLRDAGLAALTAAIVVAPYLFNCWRAFGDPLYSINVHANVYRVTEGQGAERAPSAAGYVGGKMRQWPVRTLDTAAWGLTANPFLNKWSGFRAWSPSLAFILACAAAIGLVLFLGDWPGRMLLVVLAASLLPYSVTWPIASDWRFTEHAYPFFLVASCFAIGWVGTRVAPAAIRRLVAAPRKAVRPLVVGAGVMVVVGTGWWVVSRALPALAVFETLAAGEDVTIPVSDRDVAFFAGGWSAPMTADGLTVRVAVGTAAELRLVLPTGRDYGMTIRLDPYPRPQTETLQQLSAVEVLFNGVRVSQVHLGWTPTRVGAYEFTVPRAAVRFGINRLKLVTAGSQFSLWYIRVRPGEKPLPE